MELSHIGLDYPNYIHAYRYKEKILKAKHNGTD